MSHKAQYQAAYRLHRKRGPIIAQWNRLLNRGFFAQAKDLETVLVTLDHSLDSLDSAIVRDAGKSLNARMNAELHETLSDWGF